MNTSAMFDQAKACEEAGFIQAAAELRTKADRARRAAIAYEKYRYVTEENIKAFNAKLKKDTSRYEGSPGRRVQVYDKLVMGRIESYGMVPPADVLEKVKQVRAEGMFDTLEVAKIESTREYIDPIVFGVIEGCPDRFYICQWDNDVKIEDILAPNEG